MRYTHTHREEFAIKLFERLEIYEPHQIDPMHIGEKLQVHVKYHNKPSFYESIHPYRAIYLEQGISRERQRLQFFHELGHCLRHSGSQLFMPSSFAELQEWDAKHFEFYAAMPWSMMRKFDLLSPYIVEELRDAFIVPKPFIEKKLLFVQQKSKEYEEVTKL